MEIKKQHIYITSLLALLAISYLSCKKTGETTVSEPVVQAYLYYGHPITVKLYQQKSLSDTANYGSPITGQHLTVSDGTTKVTLTETTIGVYTYADSTFLVAGKTYTLNFEYLNKPVSAQTLMPQNTQNFATRYSTVNYVEGSAPSAKPDTLNNFTWDNPDSLNHVLVFNNLDGNFFPVSGMGIGRGQAVPNAFEYDTNRGSAFYVVTNSFPYFGDYQVILLSVNKEYVDLLKSNTFGANSQNLLNTPTNVVNGLGIFTAMQSDTLLFSLNDQP